MHNIHLSGEIADVTTGHGKIVRCPDCGQMEIWTALECQDHGICRATSGACPVCDEVLEPMTDADRARLAAEGDLFWEVVPE